MIPVAVFCEDPTRQLFAEKLAKELHLTLVPNFNERFSLYLVVTSKRLQLQAVGEDAGGPVFVDFIKGPLGYRISFGGGRRQLLARAVGLKAKTSFSVIDVTAGFGRDAYVLAYLGCDVTMVESSPIVVALLKDGLSRAAASKPAFSALKFRLVAADALRYLNSLSPEEYPDVIYLDPMFPETKKSAAVRKEMRVLRQVVGDDENGAALFLAARKSAKKRVVVKRHRYADSISAIKPDLVVKGKASRFDVYLIANAIDTEASEEER